MRSDYSADNRTVFTLEESAKEWQQLCGHCFVLHVGYTVSLGVLWVSVAGFHSPGRWKSWRQPTVPVCLVRKLRSSSVSCWVFPRYNHLFQNLTSRCGEQCINSVDTCVSEPQNGWSVGLCRTGSIGISRHVADYGPCWVKRVHGSGGRQSLDQGARGIWLCFAVFWEMHPKLSRR